MCGKAMQAAERPEEKKLVLTVMERYPSLDMLKLAAAATKDAAVKNEAGLAAMVIAQKAKADAAETEKLLTEAGQPPVKVEIVKAEYGAGDKIKDVTAILPIARRQRAADPPADFAIRHKPRRRSRAGRGQAVEDPIPDQRQARRSLAERGRAGVAADAEIRTVTK